MTLSICTYRSYGRMQDGLKSHSHFCWGMTQNPILGKTLWTIILVYIFSFCLFPSTQRISYDIRSSRWQYKRCKIDRMNELNAVVESSSHQNLQISLLKFLAKPSCRRIKSLEPPEGCHALRLTLKKEGGSPTFSFLFLSRKLTKDVCVPILLLLLLL